MHGHGWVLRLAFVCPNPAILNLLCLAQVVKAMGLGRPPVPSPEEAYAQAQSALESVSLPLTLDTGATVTECATCVACSVAALQSMIRCKCHLRIHRALPSRS